MDNDNLKSYYQMIDSGDKFYNQALSLVGGQKFLEAKAYFSDAYNYYLKAENIALDNKYFNFASQAKTKKIKAREEEKECDCLYRGYCPIDLEI